MNFGGHFSTVRRAWVLWNLGDQAPLGPACVSGSWEEVVVHVGWWWDGACENGRKWAPWLTATLELPTAATGLSSSPKSGFTHGAVPSACGSRVWGEGASLALWPGRWTPRCPHGS